jgi:uncharacterized membrane protein YgcG
VAAALELQVAELSGVAPPPPLPGPPAAPPTPPLVIAIDLVEASTIASLHAHAAGVHNIWSLNSHWRDLVMLTLQRFALDDHFTVDTVPSTTPSWLRMDNVVLSWLLGSLSVDLQATVRERGGTARQVWLAIEDQFLGSHEARTLYLDTQFRNFVQGDLSVDDYCRRMKTMYDDLRDLGAHIDDRTVVLKTVLKRTKSFPSFREARNDLLLEELTLDAKTTSGSASAFTTSSGPQQRHQISTTFGASHATPPSGGGGRGGSGRGGGGHGRGGSSGGASSSTS